MQKAEFNVGMSTFSLTTTNEIHHQLGQREVFAGAYERSCQRYTLIKQALPEPDPLRLQYREQLSAVVAAIVRGGTDVTTRSIQNLAASQVALRDMHAFVALTINELHQLHEGNIARHRLRLSEFQRWRDTNPLGPRPEV